MNLLLSRFFHVNESPPRPFHWVRPMAAVMAVVVFYADVLAPPLAQASFWEERRLAVQGLKERAGRGGHEGLSRGDARFASSLHGGLAVPDDPVKLHLTQGTTSAPHSAPSGSATEAPLIQPLGPPPSRRLGPSWAGEIARAIGPYGAVSDVYFPPETKTPLVIHIQDAHEHPEAQQNIARIIERLVDRYGVKLVGLEGATGPFDFTPYRAFPNKELTQGVAEFFLREGFIGGAEFAGITAARPPRFWGIEEPGQYLEHIEAYQRSVPVRQEARRYMRWIAQTLREVEPPSSSFPSPLEGEGWGEGASQRPLTELRQDAGLLEKLIEYRLTADEWAGYVKRHTDIRQLDSRLTKLSQTRSLPSALPDLEPFEAFYRQALRREPSLVSNLFMQMDLHQHASAVLLAGGFHTSGLTTLLKQRGVGYLTITPRISKTEPWVTSLDKLAREKTPLERLFASERFFLSTPRSFAATHPYAPYRGQTWMYAGTWFTLIGVLQLQRQLKPYLRQLGVSRKASRRIAREVIKEVQAMLNESIAASSMISEIPLLDAELDPSGRLRVVVQIVPQAGIGRTLALELWVVDSGQRVPTSLDKGVVLHGVSSETVVFREMAHPFPQRTVVLPRQSFPVAAHAFHWVSLGILLVAMSLFYTTGLGPLIWFTGVNGGFALSVDPRILSRAEKEAVAQASRRLIQATGVLQLFKRLGYHPYLVLLVGSMSPEGIAIRGQSDVDLKLLFRLPEGQHWEEAVTSLQMKLRYSLHFARKALEVSTMTWAGELNWEAFKAAGIQQVDWLLQPVERIHSLMHEQLAMLAKGRSTYLYKLTPFVVLMQLEEGHGRPLFVSPRNFRQVLTTRFRDLISRYRLGSAYRTFLTRYRLDARRRAWDKLGLASHPVTVGFAGSLARLAVGTVGRTEITSRGHTVHDVLYEYLLRLQWMWNDVVNANGDLLPGITVTLNGTDVKALDGLDTRLEHAGDVIKVSRFGPPKTPLAMWVDPLSLLAPGMLSWPMAWGMEWWLDLLQLLLSLAVERLSALGGTALLFGGTNDPRPKRSSLAAALSHDPEVVQLLQQGEDLMKEKKFLEAASAFEQARAREQTNPFPEAFRFVALGRAAMENDQVEEKGRLLEPVIQGWASVLPRIEPQGVEQTLLVLNLWTLYASYHKVVAAYRHSSKEDDPEVGRLLQEGFRTYQRAWKDIGNAQQVFEGRLSDEEQGRFEKTKRLILWGCGVFCLDAAQRILSETEPTRQTYLTEGAKILEQAQSLFPKDEEIIEALQQVKHLQKLKQMNALIAQGTAWLDRTDRTAEELAQAVNMLREAMTLAAELPPQTREFTDAQIRLGRLLLRVGDEKGLRLIETALQLALTKGWFDELESAWVWEAVAKEFDGRGNHHRARFYLEEKAFPKVRDVLRRVNRHIEELLKRRGKLQLQIMKRRQLQGNPQELAPLEDELRNLKRELTNQSALRLLGRDHELNLSLTLGDVYTNLGDLDRGLELYRETLQMIEDYQWEAALLQNPGWDEELQFTRYLVFGVYLNMANAYRERADYDQSEHWLDQAEKACQRLQVQHPEAAFVVAVTRVFNGLDKGERPERMLEEIDKVTQVVKEVEREDPDTASHLRPKVKFFLPGLLALRERRFKDAIEKFQATQNLLPHYQNAYNSLATAYRLDGAYGKAEAAIQTAISRWPDEPQFHAHLALIQIKQGRWPEATARIREYQEQYPQLPNVAYVSALCLLEQLAHEPASKKPLLLLKVEQAFRAALQGDVKETFQDLELLQRVLADPELTRKLFNARLY
ncbi:MAG: hypothetical protein HYZ73_02025, partial [Elusimicrobia bacterium]|nr:hypothetical protein [Elusimicrobiota bacterium]